MESPQNTQKIQVKASDEALKGSYANAMSVTHTKEEFILDFLSLFPPQGIINARIIMSPGHLKRVVAALADNLKKYEDKFGKIKESEEPKGATVGFQDRG